MGAMFTPLACLAFLFVQGCGSVRNNASQLSALSEDDALAWVRHATPLPKQIKITGRVHLRPEEVAFDLGGLSWPLVHQAVRELQESLDQNQSSSLDTASKRFTIAFQLGGVHAPDLKALKNSDQAYRIFPAERNHGLHLVALTPKGLYYASKTLQQLIKAKRTEAGVSMPLLRVTDWPDLADRGVWGTDTPLHIRWLSDRKFNYMEQVASHVIDENQRSVVTMNPTRRRMLVEGPTFGFNPVPAIVHLERLGGRGVYKAYPEVKGKGPGVHPGAACYSNPKIVDILADWIIGCARLPGVTEVDVWMTENLTRRPGCQCDKCRPHNRDLLEARAILAAWEKAKKTVPTVGLRLLVTEETYDSNEQILAILPKEVTFWYYHSLHTYSNRERPIIPGYVEKLARQGWRMGVVPDIGAKGSYAQPFTGAQFIRYRMYEFAEKNIAAMLGYPRPRVYYSDFNTEAAAEWSWNAKGRSAPEFAISWAVRHGFDNPGLFAEWSETLGPVSWDIYGSEWPRGEARKNVKSVAELLCEGGLPELGTALSGPTPKPWGEIRSVRQLNDDVAQAAHAIELARTLGLARYLEESRVIHGYITTLKALYELKQIAIAGQIPDDKRSVARQHFQNYVDGLRQAQDALARWEDAVGPWPGHPRTTPNTISLLQTLIDQMTQAAAECGCPLKNG